MTDFLQTIGWALGAIAALAALIAIATPRRREQITSAVLRLDCFLPFLRKKKKGETLSPDTLGLRLAKRVLPRTWFANRTKGKPGWLRKTLVKLGPSVLSSPARRAVQTFCFVAFCVLFFYVCWPYTARPAPPGKISAAWRVVAVDQQTGVLQIANNQPPAWTTQVGKQVFLAAKHPAAMDPATGEASDVVAFVISDDRPMSSDKNTSDKKQHHKNQILLAPLVEITPQQFDDFLLRAGPWFVLDQRPHQWPSHYADDLAGKEWAAAELFLIIDPLVSFSTAIASRNWVWSLAFGAGFLVICLLIPRGFCGWVCPLGTLLDLADFLVFNRLRWFRLPSNGWWVHIKYYLLAGVLLAAACGVLLSGYVAAIPLLTRGAYTIASPLQNGLLRQWRLIPPVNAGQFFSMGLFVLVLGMGMLRPRFWCKYVCPSGAMFSLGNLFRLTERKVESSCIHCNKCVEICPFDAIKPDFNTRVSDCTMCQTCGGVCPTQAIKFVERWNFVELKVENTPPTHETSLGRRGFLSLAIGAAAAVSGGVGAAWATKASGSHANALAPVRPPGSAPEQDFLQMCIRCGECFQACPNNVLQMQGFQQGFEGLWTPLVAADWAGCESSCNACGQVCPTGAIRALPLEEKKAARMGLAMVNQQTCLPLAGREDCRLCVDECNAAGYAAIEFQQVNTEVDLQGRPIEGAGFLAPVVLANLCVGCGLCQTRCYGVNVKEKHLLAASAIVIEAGEGKEDRILHGSYIGLRADEKKQAAASTSSPRDDDFYIPGSTANPTPPNETSLPPQEEKTPATDDPFGLD